MRDHRKLRAFELADELVLEVYRATKTFPRDEMFGLTSQLRRAAVSTASNIVEGCARQSQADFVRFLDMAFASAREVEYQLSIAARLGYLPAEFATSLNDKVVETSKVTYGLLKSLRNDS
jgi:four helix bundle protein